MAASGRAGSGELLGAIAIGPDADVILLERQPYPVLEPQGLDVGAGQLQPADAIEDGVLLGDDVMVAGLRDRRRRSVSVLVRPSRIAIVRLTCSLTSGSWVTTTIVTPSSRFTVRISSKTSCAVAVSSSPVGSSAKSTSGSLASATAMATRCCSPPDSWSGR